MSYKANPRNSQADPEAEYRTAPPVATGVNTIIPPAPASATGGAPKLSVAPALAPPMARPAGNATGQERMAKMAADQSQPWHWDRRTQFIPPQQLPVHAPPVFTPDEIMKKAPAMVAEAAKMMRAQWERATPAQREATQFMRDVGHNAEQAAAEALAVMHSDVLAPDRGLAEEKYRFTKEHSQALESQPVERYLNWVTAIRPAKPIK